MKQTAVELLIKEIKNDAFVHSKSTKEWNYIFQQAKEMEKEQIKKAFLKNHLQACWMNKTEEEIAEQYYNETYEK